MSIFLDIPVSDDTRLTLVTVPGTALVAEASGAKKSNDIISSAAECFISVIFVEPDF